MPHPTELQPNGVTQIHVETSLDKRLVHPWRVGVEAVRVLHFPVEVVAERLAAKLSRATYFRSHYTLVPAAARV